MANDCRTEGEARGRAAGLAEGEVRGKFIAYYEMVRKGFLMPRAAVAALHQTASVFNAGLQKYIAGLR